MKKQKLEVETEFYYDVFVKYYDEKTERVVKRCLTKFELLTLVSFLLREKKLGWLKYGSKVMNKHYVESVRIE